jgi:hypothetical protein
MLRIYFQASGTAPHLQLDTHQSLDELRAAQPGGSKQRRPAAMPDGIDG